MKLTWIFTLLLFAGEMCCAQQSATQKFNLASIPYPLTWHNAPMEWEVAGNSFVLIGGKGSRLFNDPQRLSPPADTAPIALFKPDTHFMFSCKMKVDFRSKFDAGVLMVYGNSEQWAKLCFEYSPQEEPMVVTVINNVLSDDSNNAILENDEVYARISGLGNGVYTFHYSLDGKFWHLARYFYLDPVHDLKIGFLSQSPNGDFCKTVFSEIKYNSNKLKDYRSGE